MSMAYFRPNGQFDDFVVHEAAHIFHNCKRQTIGLPATGRREWLLDIDFGKRETFAYGCEVYSRMLQLGRSAAARCELLSQAENGLSLPDDRVVASEHQHSPCCRRRPKWMEGNSAELQTSSPETGHFDEPGDMM